MSSKSNPELLNSSFYSSHSINTLDHAKTFRNSLILNVLSDNSIANSVNEIEEDVDGADVTYVDDNMSDRAVKRDEYSSSSTLMNETSHPKERSKKKETQTLNMSTSPSLSALANILQEKSKTADQKMRNSVLIHISEEQEDQYNTEDVGTEKPVDDADSYNKDINDQRMLMKQLDEDTSVSSGLIASPNLIDIDGTNNIKYTTSGNTIDNQPDFLTTPKIEHGQNLQKGNFTSSLNVIKESPVKKPNIVTEEPSKLSHIPVSTTSGSNEQLNEDMRGNSENELRKTHNEHHKSQQNIFNKPVQHNSSTKSYPQLSTGKVQPVTRSVTNEQIKQNLLRKGPKMNPSVRASRTVSTGPVLEQTSKYREKKGFFSFLKKKGRNSIKNDSSEHTKPSIKFNNNASTNNISEVTKKTHSNGNIFGNFKKKKADTTVTNNTNTSRTTVNDSSPEENLNVPKVRKQSEFNVPTPFAVINETDKNKDLDKRKPTPLDFGSSLDINTDVQQKLVFDSNDNEKNYTLGSPDVESPVFSLPRPDAGEALFPKFLNSLEVDSIVSMERTRSIKSNKRNSINSNRRSLTDALSINAQNEGMFIIEVGSVVLSTPDLTKSPASSILRSGKFETPIDMDSTSNIDDSVNDKNNTNQINNESQEYDDNIFSMRKMEDEFEQILAVREDEHKKNSIEKGLAVTRENPIEVYEEDEQLMSDIMDFANIIDFGDEIDLGLGLSVDHENSHQKSEIKHMNPSNRQSRKENNIPAASINYDAASVEEEAQVSDQEDNDDVFKYEILQDRNNNVSTLPSPHLNEKDSDRISFDGTSFENENFNEIEETQIFTEDDLMGIDNDGNAIADTGSEISRSYGLKDGGFNSGKREEIIQLPVNPQLKLTVAFSSEILLFETYGEEEYDRRPEIATCNLLTPQLAQMIKAELNEIKDEMSIHEESKCYTHYY